jgi:hypothetical protein
MPTLTVNKLIRVPTVHESSRLRPSGDSDDVRQAWKASRAQREQLMAAMESIQLLSKKVDTIRRRILGGAGGAAGWQWQAPYKEIDPTLLVAQFTFVYITSGNTLVTAGMTDLTSMANQKACEGMWQAAVDVPATTDGVHYNVPTFPYTGATGTPTGSPGSVMGDLDTAGIFWIYWGQVAC